MLDQSFGADGGDHDDEGTDANQHVENEYLIYEEDDEYEEKPLIVDINEIAPYMKSKKNIYRILAEEGKLMVTL